MSASKGGTRMNSQHPPRRRKRRPMNGVKTVEVVRGTVGYGFTISGQNPCTLSCIVSGSPAEAIGLKPGDFLLAVNGENVSKYPHDEVVRIIGTSVGTLTLQVAENLNSSDSSDDDVPQRQKFHHPNRVRPRRVLKDYNYRDLETRETSNQSHDFVKTSYSSTNLKSKQANLNEVSNIWDLNNKNHDQQEPFAESRNMSAFQYFSRGSLGTTGEQKISNSHELKSHSNSMDNLNTISNLRTGRLSTPLNRTMSVESEESEEEWSPEQFPNSKKHFVVGYIGSIEMPSDKNWQYAHLQSFHSAVRRLRTEKKIHTLVVMSISTEGVKLTNAVRKVLAVYPVNKIAFCGLCPDDNHFFGIVTFHSSLGDDVGNANVVPSCSCHVFRVNPEMQPHCMHAQKARIFQFECTHGSSLQRCYEFPKTAAPVIRPISKLYKKQWQNNNNNNNKVPMAQVFMEPQLATDHMLSSSGSSCHSSNSDSGLGFSKDDSHNDGVFIVDMNQSQCNQRRTTFNRMTSSATSLSHGIHHLSPSNDTMPTPQSAFRQTAKLNAQAKVLPTKGDPKQGRLTLRAMPDPVFAPTVPTSFGGCFPHQRYRSKLNVEHRSRSREPAAKKNASEQRSASTERALDFRSVSAPFRQLSNGKLTVVESTENKDSLEDKLSPRATFVTPKFKMRSPSAPPPGSSNKDLEWSPDIRRPLEEIFAIFEKDDNLNISENKSDMRRLSDGQALLAAQKESHSKVESQKWKKTGSFRRPKVSKLSHSHESLIANENDGMLHHKISSANSIHSIVNHSDVDAGPGRKVSRVAAWAVSFNRLLEDPEGVFVFTEFLRKEFSEENIQFWLAVDNFKRSMDPDKRNILAAEIFEKHLGAKATEPVNVDSLARHTAQQHLNASSLTMFDAAQKQIFQLMKQDSYSRFLKSDLYKTQLVAEMGGKVMVSALKKPAVFSKAGKEVDKEKLTKGKEEEKRRWSLLFWKQKSSKQSEMQKLTKLTKEESKKKVSLATMDLSLMRKEVIQNKDSALPEDFKFCRVLLPDNSTAVVCARPGQTIHEVLGQLFDKRNLTTESTEVFLLGSDKPLDLSEDMSTLGSKEVNVERRVYFQVEISSQKTIGVKAKLNKTIYDVFRPILQKYGYKIENVILQLTEQQEALDLQMPVSTIHDTHISVISKEDNIEETLSRTLPRNNKATWLFYSPSSTPGNPAGATLSAATSLEEITNKVFEDLMHGKSESAQPLTNTGVNVHDPKKSQPTPCREQLDGDPHYSDTFGLQRRKSLGRKEPELKLSQSQGLSQSLGLSQSQGLNLICSSNKKMKAKSSLPNKDHSISVEGKTRNLLHSRESLCPDLKREFSSATNFHLMIKEDKPSQQKIVTSSSLSQLTGDYFLHESQQDGTFVQDDDFGITSDICTPTPTPTKPNFTTTPASIWTRRTEKTALKSNKFQKSRISPSKSSCLKFGADARDIQHFKTFGSSPDRTACTPQKDPEKQIIMTSSDYKDAGDNKSLSFYEGPLSCRSKASFLQESRKPTGYKAKKKIANLNLISTAPIASSEELSPTPDEVRYKKARKPNLRIKPISTPSPPPYPQYSLNSSELMNESGDYIPTPSKSKKHFVFIPPSQKIPETEAHRSKRKEKLNCSPVSRYNLSIPPSPASLSNEKSPSVFQLDVSANPQVTFV